jgi:hypothetical protein
MVTFWLAEDEQESPVQSLWFGSEDAVETLKAVGECLAVVHKSAHCRYLEGDPPVPTVLWSG